jgi:hypothetical protein
MQVFVLICIWKCIVTSIFISMHTCTNDTSVKEAWNLSLCWVMFLSK